MYREKDKRTKLGVMYGLIVIVIAAVSVFSIYQQHKNDIKLHQSSFKVPKLPELNSSQERTLVQLLNLPMPSLGTGYSLIFESPSTSSPPPEIDYLTNYSTQSIVANARNICSTYNMTTKKTSIGYDIINPTESYQITTVQCYDANNSWSFNIESAIALSTPEYDGTSSYQTSNVINGQVPASALKSDLSSEQWVNIRSLGSPIVKCNIDKVCYIQKSNLVSGS